MAIGSKTGLFVRKQPGGLFSVVDERITTGDIFFVDSTHADKADSVGAGANPDRPYATLAYAVAQATANKGDIVYVAPKHVENIATDGALAIAKAGMSVIGLGVNYERPTFTLTAASACVSMSGSDSLIKNLIFKVSQDVTKVIDVNASGCTIDGCVISYGTGKEFTTGILVSGGAANVCNRTTIKDCVILSTTAGASQGIELGQVANFVTIEGCTILGDYTNAAIHNPTGMILTNLIVKDCILQNTQTGDHAIELVSACTGMLIRNVYYSNITQATAADPGSCFSIECYHCDAVDVSGILCPAAT